MTNNDRAAHLIINKVVVNNNGLLGQILWEQMVLGYAEYGVRFQEYPDFAPWAQACGGLGIRVEKPRELEGALTDTRSTFRPGWATPGRSGDQAARARTPCGSTSSPCGQMKRPPPNIATALPSGANLTTTSRSESRHS